MVLGKGPLAEAMAADLSREPDLHVTLADASDPARVGALVSDCGAVLSAAEPRAGAAVLRAVIEANRMVADAVTPVAEAIALHELALRMDVAACVGCDGAGLTRLLGARASLAPLSADRLPALMAAALARRLLSGDFRGHWGVWAPDRLAARVGLAHGIAQDLRERGVAL